MYEFAAKIAEKNNKDERAAGEDPITQVELLGEEKESSLEDAKGLLSKDYCQLV